MIGYAIVAVYTFLLMLGYRGYVEPKALRFGSNKYIIDFIAVTIIGAIAGFTGVIVFKTEMIVVAVIVVSGMLAQLVKLPNKNAKTIPP